MFVVSHGCVVAPCINVSSFCFVHDIEEKNHHCNYSGYYEEIFFCHYNLIISFKFILIIFYYAINKIHIR